MAEQITIEQALELVEFEHGPEGWRVKNVKVSVCGHVLGNVCGNVRGDVFGDVQGDIYGDVWGCFYGRQWKLNQAPRDKLKRMIKEGADQDKIFEALDQLLDQLEDSNG